MGGAEGPRKKRRPATKAGRRRAETWRLKKLLAYERELRAKGYEIIAGVDEAGRGPLAGPVVAAAVILPDGVAVRGVDDSKRLTAERREALFHEIRERALAVGVGAASTREVDRLNILRASHVAMKRALARLSLQPDHIIVDGNMDPGLGDACTPVIDADALVHCVACASVIAKVVRDRLMHRLAGRYPQYGWDHNAGYGTQDHRDAILELGLTPHHRRSFESNVQLLLELS